MAIDSALGRLGIKQGVCTSSTRPTNPFEGQVIYESDTNRTLVYDNAAWVVIANASSTTFPTSLDTNTVDSIAALQAKVGADGSAVTTSIDYKVAQLETNQGLIFISSGLFSAVTSFDVTGFDTTFTFYRLVLRGEGDTGNLSISARLYNGATAVTTGYYSAAGYANVTGGVGHWDDRDNGAEWNISNFANQTMIMASYDIMGDETERISFTGQYFSGISPMIYIGGSHDAVAFDRIRFTAAANMSGLWKLYGYNEG